MIKVKNISKFGFFSVLLFLSSTSVAGVVLNEVFTDAFHGGADGFVELKKMYGSGQTLGNYDLLHLDGYGNVDVYLNLDGKTFNSGNDNYETAGYIYLSSTEIGNHSLWGSAAVPEAGTWLLVGNFSGGLGQDLDPDNDGILEGEMPWTNVFDGIGWAEGGTEFTNGHWVYSDIQLVSSSIPGSGTIDAAERKVGNQTPNYLDAWWYGATDPLGTDPNRIFYVESTLGYTPGPAPVITPTGPMGYGAENYLADPIGCPEPSSLVLSGLVAGVFARYRRKKKH